MPPRLVGTGVGLFRLDRNLKIWLVRVGQHLPIQAGGTFLLVGTGAGLLEEEHPDASAD